MSFNHYSSLTPQCLRFAQLGQAIVTGERMKNLFHITKALHLLSLFMWVLLGATGVAISPATLLRNSDSIIFRYRVTRFLSPCRINSRGGFWVDVMRRSCSEP